jgi:hypothetical protein
MGEHELVVQALQQAMRGLNARPDLTDWRIGRIAELETTIREFCEYVVDTDAHIGMSAQFHKLFRDLAECVGFDAYPEDGPDPDAAYDRRTE